MSTFDALKKEWNEAQPLDPGKNTINKEEMIAMIKSRSKKQLKGPVHYFWGAMVLQIILYAILCHIILRYNDDSRIVTMGIIGVLLHVPFTWLMVRKYSRLAIIKPAQQNNAGSSLKEYVSRQKDIIQEFYSFKKKYELFLVPASTAIGTYLFFTIFFTGGIMVNLTWAMITFLLTFFTCVVTIISENRKQFDKPLRELQQIIDDFNEDD